MENLGELRKYMMQTAFSKNLTIGGGSGNTTPVAGIPATGFESPSQGGHTAIRFIGGFFVTVSMALPFLGWAVRGAFGPAGSLTRSLNPHVSAHFAFESAMGGNFLILSQGVQS